MQNQMGCFMHIETSCYTEIQSIEDLFKRISEEIVKE